MNLYFTLMTWFEFIIPAVVILGLTIFAIVKAIIITRKEKLMLSLGFKKYIRSSISGFNPSTTYNWIRESDHKIIKDYELEKMSFKEIKALKEIEA